MSEHAILSPSAAHRWLNCPGSVRLSAGIESPDTEYSREGTFAHALASACLLHDLPAASQLGVSDGEWTCDVEMAAHIQVYLDAVNGVTLALGGAETLAVEQRVELTQSCWGTADAWLIDETNWLHVFDLKFGRGHLVSAEGNPQMLTYAAAIARAVGRTFSGIALHIVQPRRLDADDRAHRTATVTHDALQDFTKRVLEASRVALDTAEAPVVPGDWCTFCPARATCPALRAVALQSAQEVFADLDTLKPVAAPELATIPAARLAAVLRAADTAEAWIAGVRRHALERARRETIPGYKVVATLSNRRWIGLQAAEAALRHAGVDPFSPPALVSPAEAERRLGTKRKHLVKPLCERVVTGATLAREDDPRPALTGSEVFPDLLSN